MFGLARSGSRWAFISWLQEGLLLSGKSEWKKGRYGSGEDKGRHVIFDIEKNRAVSSFFGYANKIRFFSVSGRDHKRFEGSDAIDCVYELNLQK